MVFDEVVESERLVVLFDLKAVLEPAEDGRRLGVRLTRDVDRLTRPAVKLALLTLDEARRDCGTER